MRRRYRTNPHLDQRHRGIEAATLMARTWRGESKPKVAKMTAMNFPVWARGRCLYDSMHRQQVIDVDVPVEVEGVNFSPGDLVFADVDGVVVVPQAVEKESITRVWNKVHAENVMRDAIKNGMKAVAAYASSVCFDRSFRPLGLG